jgi:hypothetical protein
MEHLQHELYTAAGTVPVVTGKVQSSRNRPSGEEKVTVLSAAGRDQSANMNIIN